MGENLLNTTTNPLDLAAELTIAWLGNPSTRASADEVPAFLRHMHESVAGLAGAGLAGAGQGAPEPAGAALAEHTPAVSVRKSLGSPDHLLSMIDGKPYRTLKRHLKTHGLTPEQYRTRYALKPDYPMVAPNYSEARRAMAKRSGLGRKTQQDAPEGEGITVEDQQQAAPQPGSRRKLKLRQPS